jgi:hypothetical protein
MFIVEKYLFFIRKNKNKTYNLKILKIFWIIMKKSQKYLMK